MVSFDGRKKCMVAPKWEPMGAGRIYYYVRDSVDFAYQKHQALLSGKDDSRSLSFSSDSHQDGTYDIPIFENESELKAFLCSVGNHTTTEPAEYTSKQHQCWYDALTTYNNWRATNRNTTENNV